MNIAIMSDESKQELMVQFCIAYCGILAKHTICATNTTGRMVAEATGLTVHRFLSHEQGGCQQVGQRISYNEIDMVLFFTGPNNEAYVDDLSYICHLCDNNNVPIATNICTAEMLIQGLQRGDLDWRELMYPRTRNVIL
jgi:methylglyoxal synthase